MVTRLLDEQRLHEAPTLKQNLADLPTQEQHQQNQQQKRPKATQGIIMEGLEGIQVRFGKCCNPVPGDDIVGYITRGRGVTIHKADCVNAHSGEEERRVNVAWAEESSGQFEASIQVIAYDHVSLLGELAMYIGELNVPIRAVSAKVDDKKGTSIIGMTLSVSSREQVDKVIRQLQKRQDVIEVYRSAG